MCIRGGSHSSKLAEIYIENQLLPKVATCWKLVKIKEIIPVDHEKIASSAHSVAD